MFKLALAVLFIWILVVAGALELISSMNFLGALDVIGSATNSTVNS